MQQKRLVFSLASASAPYQLVACACLVQNALAACAWLCFTSFLLPPLLMLTAVLLHTRRTYSHQAALFPLRSQP